MKNIIIKLRENEDRSIIFKMPYTSKPDLKLNLWPLKNGTINVEWEITDYKNVKETKSGGNIGKEERKDNDKR